MSLASLLSSEQIIPEMKATERWPAIVELIDLLVAQQKIDPASRGGSLGALKQREETMSTGIGLGSPFRMPPPTRSPRSSPPFGRSSQGIEFDALDSAPSNSSSFSSCRRTSFKPTSARSRRSPNF
jgi:Phosphotransferase system mannitol/fructose-specific IIA domain (Ntr-type)